MDSAGREIFEAMLSSTSVEAAEAWALLGSCKAAKTVGGAASLKEVCAVAVVNTLIPTQPLSLQFAVPFVCGVHPYIGVNTEFGGGPDPEYRWGKVSALPMGYVSTPGELYPGRNYQYDECTEQRLRLNEDPDGKEFSSGENLTMPGFESRIYMPSRRGSESEGDGPACQQGASAMTASCSLLSQLRTLLRRCPNVSSLRLCNPSLSDIGPFIATELGTLAPKLEVLDLSMVRIYAGSDFHAALQALPNLRILLTEAGTTIDGGSGPYFTGMSTHLSLEYVCFQVRHMEYMDPEMVKDVLSDIDALLDACPALRIFDFTESIAEWLPARTP
jgi:hypothetical protein